MTNLPTHLPRAQSGTKVSRRRGPSSRRLRLHVERLEDITLLSTTDLLNALKSDAATAKGYGTSIATDVLSNQHLDLPIFADSLGDASGVASLISNLFTAVANVNPTNTNDPNSIASALAQQLPGDIKLISPANDPTILEFDYNPQALPLHTLSPARTTNGVGDFLGGTKVSSYLTGISQLSFSSAVRAAPSGTFDLKFGVFDDPNNGNMPTLFFDPSDFKANLNVQPFDPSNPNEPPTSSPQPFNLGQTTVQVGGNTLGVNLGGTVTYNLGFDVGISGRAGHASYWKTFRKTSTAS